ncbi:unnamed protein product [Coffea canephora]|uniref:Uncharacterized protein n=1 Tax=Coffea canephora TaxID=49390 RepID=A0A068UHL8_COFCA|nr:unnamed protein product [Coffea canephora]
MNDEWWAPRRRWRQVLLHRVLETTTLSGLQMLEVLDNCKSKWCRPKCTSSVLPLLIDWTKLGSNS